MTDKLKVLLCGPQLHNKNASYGGGTGGYTRNMYVYLKYFKSGTFSLLPCFHSTRGAGRFNYIQFPLRLISDVYVFIANLLKHKPAIVHIMGQYRGATPREFAITFIAFLFKKKIIYEIKAGAFINFYSKAGTLNKYMMKFMLDKSVLILVEGEVYIDFVNKITGDTKCHFFPNFVPSDEISAQTVKFSSDHIKVLFVGFCYDGKGVFELVRGLNMAAEAGQHIQLTLIGQEAEDFKLWLNDFSLHANLSVNRMGRQKHEIVLEQMGLNDLYFYPTKHTGEGHNNSVNEAMMNNMTIVTTKIGFLLSILGDAAYFLNEVSDKSIANMMLDIAANKQIALNKGLSARARLINNYTSDIQIPILDSYYKLAIESINT